MGGIPKTAMNLVGFPVKKMDISVLRQIILGGLEKLKEAGVVLVGGHSVEDDELKYGLSVTGYVHPSRILTKKGFREGDRLILTKPLGTGIINTAIKGGLAPKTLIDEVSRLMASLNKEAAQAMSRYQVSACTDITGFGLLGHLAEMVDDSGLGVRITAQNIPIIRRTEEFARMGLLPAGAYKNREFRECMVNFDSSVDGILQDILFDPQTSGGLLIFVEKEQAADLQEKLIKIGIEGTAIIGEVVAEHKGMIHVS